MTRSLFLFLFLFLTGRKTSSLLVDSLESDTLGSVLVKFGKQNFGLLCFVGLNIELRLGTEKSELFPGALRTLDGLYDSKSYE